ncbi:response regulator [Roseateles chitosanitabidus]|uniref:response regulator n=1 Tax=Roseateles chitosanitabidus TaxID=65048 RepID=UPI00082EDF73|nr:response regulator [Roseateles chitosanitabidus]
MNDGLTSVLYIEDSPLNVIVMEAMFEQRRDLRLHIAEAGMPAWRLSSKLQPALLLVDLNLPDCHGSDLLKLLRMRSSLAQVPAIAVTADSDFDALGAGFMELWAKPLDVRRTLARLAELLPPPRASLLPTGEPGGAMVDPAPGGVRRDDTPGLAARPRPGLSAAHRQAGSMGWMR